MSINLTVPQENLQHLKPKITVVGVGGAGGNAVNNMINSQLEGVDFVVANTDAQALALSATENRIQLGSTLTQGLGAGSRPEVGRAAAEEAIEDILSELEGSHMAFIAAGMGGGTGTGGAPVIARAAKENGILTVGVVTKPFQFEGSHRMTQADNGIEELEQYVDTLIVIPNQNLFRIANEKTTFADAFSMADEVLYSGVRGVTDLMVMPGLINLDFADIRTVMSEMGKAMMGTGEAEGERRALDAAEAAIANPLLDDMSMKGARGVLINITGGMDITLFEVDEAANRIRAEVDQDAYIIVGSAFDPSMDGLMRVSVVATGIDASAQQMPLPTMLHLAEQLEQTRDYRSHTESGREMEAEAIPEPFLEAEQEEEFEVELEPEPEMEDEMETKMDTETPQPAAAGEIPVESSIEEAEEHMQEQISESALLAEETEPETPPPAMPSMGATDAFIPPEAADPGEAEVETEVAGGDEIAEVSSDSAMESEPLPAMESGRKGISLFERVTGGGRTAFGKKTPAPVQSPEVTENKELSVTEGRIEPTPEDAQPENVTNLDETAGPVDEEQQLGGMDPEDRITTSESDEDLLDIPAFLRRQAN